MVGPAASLSDSGHQKRADRVVVGVGGSKEDQSSEEKSGGRVFHNGKGVETVLASWIEIGTIRATHCRRSVPWIHGEGSVANRSER